MLGGRRARQEGAEGQGEPVSTAAEIVRREDAGAVAVVTMARPEAHNALDVALKTGLLRALADVSADPAVRAVVLAGDGRSFCVGQDLREHAALLAEGTALRTVAEHLNPLVTLLAGLPVPVVAAIGGAAAGAGLGLALACDLRVAATTAKLTTAFAGVGLGPDSGVSWLLPRLVGEARARALLLLAEPVTAEQALGMGLVNAVVPVEEVLPVALGLAERLAAGPTRAYAAVKAALRHAATHDLPATLAEEERLQAVVGATADHAEGVRAFLAREPPAFTGT